MTTLRACIVLVLGVSCLSACSTGSRNQRANIVRPGQDTSTATSKAAWVSVADGSEAVVTADEATRQPTVCDDKIIERVEERWPDGTLKLLQEVVIADDGTHISHGLETRFWENGNKKYEMGYDCGVKEGPRVAWFDDGQPWSTGEFINGKEHGLWSVWYTDGQRAQEFTMVHGAWHGTQTVWYPNGREKMIADWVDGQKQGPLRMWDSEGNLVVHSDYADNAAQPTPAPLDR